MIDNKFSLNNEGESIFQRMTDQALEEHIEFLRENNRLFPNFPGPYRGWEKKEQIEVPKRPKESTRNIADVEHLPHNWILASYAALVLMQPNLRFSAFDLATLGGDRKPTSIGDTSCTYNAKSPYLQCAVNPEGNCSDYSHFESRI